MTKIIKIKQLQFGSACGKVFSNVRLPFVQFTASKVQHTTEKLPEGETKNVSFVKKSLSVFGKLTLVLLLLAAFAVGAGGVLLMALRNPEVKVPQVVGKDFSEGEKELAQIDLKIRKRTDRFSGEKPNTILEQSPVAGETLKAGQTVAVVISRAEAEGDEKPAEVKKETVTDKPKGVDEPSEVDKARQKRKAANKNANANSNANGNSNANSASNSNGGNNNSGGNSNGNSNGKPAGNSNSTNRNSTTPAVNRNSNSATRPSAANANRRPQ